MQGLKSHASFLKLYSKRKESQLKPFKLGDDSLWFAFYKTFDSTVANEKFRDLDCSSDRMEKEWI